MYQLISKEAAETYPYRGFFSAIPMPRYSNPMTAMTVVAFMMCD